MENNSKFDLLVGAFRTQFNAHFAFNSMNIVQHFITVGDKEAALRSLKQFSQLIRYYMRHYGQQFTALQEEVNMLAVYLQLQEMRYGNSIKIEVEPFHALTGLVREIPSMLLASILSSVVENILQTGRNDLHISVSFRETAKQVRLLLRANAIPVDPFHRADSPPGYREATTSWKTQIEQWNLLLGTNLSYTESYPIDTADQYRLEVRICVD